MEAAASSIRNAADQRLRNRSGEATFLCYHSVAPEGPEYLSVTPELFEGQLDAIRRRGLATGGIRELTELAAGRPIPATVFLTFDDGFVDNHEVVLPLLRQLRMRAFVFVLPPKVDEWGAFDWPEVRDDLGRYPERMRSIGWEALAEMADGSFEVGSHTLTHPHLPELGDEQLREELWDSRSRIREKLGRCDVIAYPFGESSARVEAAAAACGYSFAFTLPTRDGQSEATTLSIPRINVDYRDQGSRYEMKLRPAGKWILLSPRIRSLQKLIKRD